MTLERSKTITDIATAWIGVIALVAGGGFAVYQYLQKENGDRVKETLNFLDRYNKSPFSEARRTVAGVWERHSDKQNVLLSKSPFSAQEYNDFALDVIQHEKIGPDILLLIEFFESLEICVRKEICDSQVAMLFFQPEARALYNQHFAKISFERTKRTDPRLAHELEAFCQRK